jgi:hypothetical protein
MATSAGTATLPFEALGTPVINPTAGRHAEELCARFLLGMSVLLEPRVTGGTEVANVTP